MIDIHRLRERIREVSLSEESKEAITVQGETLEAAISRASIELNVSQNHLEYEIIQKGSLGILQFGKIPCVIRVSIAPREMLEEHTLHDEEMPALEDEKQGKVFVKLDGSGSILMRVVQPTGKNKNANMVTQSHALRTVTYRTLSNVDDRMVENVVKKGSGKFTKIGEYKHNMINDARINCMVSDDEMKAEIYVAPPGIDGMDVTYRQIIAVLKENGVTYGIETAAIKEYAELPRYNTVILAAQGTPSIPGKDSEIVYKYKKEAKKSTNVLDYKETAELPNIHIGDLIAEKTDPGTSIPGTTVRGRYVLEKDGADIAIKTGSHVTLSDDGKKVFAAADGLVRVTREGVISVDPVYIINGDVGIKTGNIRFLGTVIVRGNVEDGVVISAKANINVYGLVGKAILRSGGSIILHRGIAGKGGAKIIAEENIKAHFVENSYVECGNILAVSDGIINSTVLSQNSIICRGRRANIIAGHVMAKNYIDAKNVGATSGSRTIVEVGYNPKTMLHLRRLNEEKKRLIHQLDTVNLNINTFLALIKRLQDSSSEIPEDKRKQAEQLKLQKNEITEKLDTIKTFLSKFEEEIAGQPQNKSQITVFRKIHSGTRVVIFNKFYDVRKELSNMTFCLEDYMISMKSYVEPKIEIPEF